MWTPKHVTYVPYITCQRTGTEVTKVIKVMSSATLTAPPATEVSTGTEVMPWVTGDDHRHRPMGTPERGGEMSCRPR